MTVFRLQDAFKMSSRLLQDVLEDDKLYILENKKLLSRRRIQDIFKNILKTSWRPTNVCWDIFLFQISLADHEAFGKLLSSRLI